MSTDTDVPATQNEDYGFYGTMRDHALDAWPMAVLTIARTLQRPRREVRAFLDSAGGRHFANEVLSHLDRGCTLNEAIDAVVQRWNAKIIAGRFIEEFCVIEGRSLLLVKVIEAGDYEAQFPAED